MHRKRILLPVLVAVTIAQFTGCAKKSDMEALQANLENTQKQVALLSTENDLRKGELAKLQARLGDFMEDQLQKQTGNEKKRVRIRALQTQLQDRQAEIDRAATVKQIGVNLLKELASASLKDQTIRALLAENGYTVSIGENNGSSSASLQQSNATQNNEGSPGDSGAGTAPMPIEDDPDIASLERAINAQLPALEQSKKIQKSVGDLAKGILEIAPTDQTANAIVSKYKITNTRQ